MIFLTVLDLIYFNIHKMDGDMRYSTHERGDSILIRKELKSFYVQLDPNTELYVYAIFCLLEIYPRSVLYFAKSERRMVQCA